ncbi:hypothetical protein NQ317_014990 [Molorchus minor]|uniref:Transcription initiation factor TFIID 150 kDa subunit n=1 Tax=Molorchus minor TaxID=1323400 RepID=A0ABQ9J4Z3_9CUCU|nr:hypothetical protein NQ317_014990 [Molorchus minor]
MAGLRNTHGICPPEVIRFLLDLFKYNDNSKNRHSDNYYRSALVEALGNTITPVVSVVSQGTPITAENLSADTKLILEEVTRLLNFEKALPCYKYTVSVACLRVIRKLQKFGHLPSRPYLFKSYASYGHFIDVRLAALECLVDFVKADGKWEDLQYVMDILENDPDPGLRHKLAGLLIKIHHLKELIEEGLIFLSLSREYGITLRRRDYNQRRVQALKPINRNIFQIVPFRLGPE